MVASESQAEESARRVAVEAGMRFLAIDTAGMKDLPPHAEMLKDAPAMVWLEPDEWMEVPAGRRHSGLAEGEAAHPGATRRLGRGLRPAEPGRRGHGLRRPPTTSRAPSTARHLRPLPRAAAEAAQLGEEFIEDLGAAAFSDALRASPAKLGKWVEQECESPRRRKLALLYLRRLGRREQRPLSSST